MLRENTKVVYQPVVAPPLIHCKKGSCDHHKYLNQMADKPSLGEVQDPKLYYQHFNGRYPIKIANKIKLSPNKLYEMKQSQIQDAEDFKPDPDDIIL